MSRSRNLASWCPACGALVQRVTVDEAAIVAHVDSMTVYRWVEAGAIHHVQTEGGVPLLCAVSLRDLVQTGKDEGTSIRLSPIQARALKPLKK